MDEGGKFDYSGRMIRVVMIVLLFAVMMPVAWLIKSTHEGLSDYGRDLWFAGVVGFVICYGLWHWDEKIRQRGGKDN